MAHAVMISEEEYLRTSYEHDCEWVEGELIERAMPDELHSAMQQFFFEYFGSIKRELGVRVRPELRVRVSARRYRIPDVTLLLSSAPFQPIPDTAPLLCIEILSRDDRPGELQEKLDDYIAMGVPNIWVVDPRRRKLSTVDAKGTHPVESFHVPGSHQVITKVEIFAELDELGPAMDKGL